MKIRWMLPFILGLTFIGCSSTSDTSSTQSISKNSLAEDLDLPEEFLNSSVQPDINSALAAIPLVNFEDVKNAFSEAGFSLDEEEAQGMDIQFRANSAEGELKVYAQKMESVEQAETFVQNKIEALEADGYTLQDTQSTDSTTLSTLVLPSTGVHCFVGLDKEATRVYVLEEVAESSHSRLEQALQSLGF